MNDDELIAAVRESFTGVRSATAAERIVRRGRAVRARRRVFGVAAPLGAAAAVAVAVSVALPASHPAGTHPAASHPAGSTPGGGHPAGGHPASAPVVQLTAWTVSRQADGSIKVTFREATDPAGLQRRLRADGVPASVTFTGHQNPACRPYGSNGGPPTPSWGKPFRSPLARVLRGDIQNLLGDFRDPAGRYTTQYALVIDPTALPSAAGPQLWTSGTPGAADNFQLHVSLVRASRRCTGS